MIQESENGLHPARDLRRIVPSGVAMLALLVLLIAARFYEVLPIKPPECGFRKIVGFPCLGCGGTRCMIALSQGKFVGGFLFNPAVFLGCVAIVLWFVRSFYEFWNRIPQKPSSPAKRRILKWLMTVGLPLLLLLNWIYLAVYLPEAG